MHYPPLNKMKIYMWGSSQIDQNSPTLVLRVNRIFKIRWHGKWALRYRGICLPNWVQMLRGRWRGKICLPGLVRPTDWTFRGVGKIFGGKTWSEMKHVRDHSSLDHYFFHLGVGFLKGIKNCLIFQFSKHPSFSPFDRGATKWLPAIPICGPLESSQYLRKPVYYTLSLLNASQVKRPGRFYLVNSAKSKGEVFMLLRCYHILRPLRWCIQTRGLVFAVIW